ncbi:MAG: DUF4105 domain-containing protein [Bdellovibrionales bacterium]|nr:DUF4105 domain-containing protein [Bdellovibrionales bacterium]
MSEPAGVNTNLHAQCRFPARYKLLKRMLYEKSSSWPQVLCPDYLTFSHRGQIESISLIFATGYLSNPASYFGHPLIKFNLPASKMPSSLLDVSVNFGAVTPPDENGFVYAAKGLFGGYDATFSHRKFYYNNHAYGEVELRDMWEYRLNLNSDEVELFYSHIWELLGKKFPYFFFTENCASAAAAILEQITGEKVLPSYLPYALPYILFDGLAYAQRSNGEPLVRSISLIPSRQTRLIARYKDLSSDQKKSVQMISNGAPVSPILESLPPQTRAAPIETLLDYYSFLAVKDKNFEEKNEAFSKRRQELLVERLELPSSTPTEMNYNLNPPSKGPRPFLLRAGVINSSKFRTGGEFQLRTTYYDFLSLDFGRPKFSEVKTLDATFNYFDNSIWMRKLDLIAISTLNLSQTGLPDEGGWAWRFSTGVENLNLACKYCDLFKVEVGFGKGFLILDRQAIFVLVDVRAQTRTENSGTLASTPMLGALIDWFPSGLFKTELNFGYRAYLEKDDADATMIKIDNRLGLSRDWDLRISYEKHVDEWIRLSISWYL